MSDPSTSAEPTASPAPAIPAAVPAVPAVPWEPASAEEVGLNEAAAAANLKGRRRLVRPLLLAGAIVFIAGCAIAIIAIVGANIGLPGLLVGSAAAVLPVPVLASCFLWLDRYEPEPAWALILIFGWGAFTATLAALFANEGAATLFAQWGLPKWLVAVLVAPLVEETAKALGPLAILLFFRREFSGLVDGIVYCGLAATGFAMMENILYLGGYGYAAGAEKYGPATGALGVIAMFIGRIMLTGFAHPLFTSMTGLGLGISARSASRRVRVLAPVAGWIVAMMLHGSWNLMATLAQRTGELRVMLYGYFAVMMPIFLTMVGLAIWLRAWEGRLTQRSLPTYVFAGWISPPEVASLATLARRHAARSWARRVAGDAGRKAMRDFQFAATRLALLRDGMQRGLDRKPSQARRSKAEERALLDVLSKSRQVFGGRDPLAPPAFWDGRHYQVTFPDGVQRTLAAPDEPVVPIPLFMPQPVYAYPPPGYPAGYPSMGGPGYQPGYPVPVSGYPSAQPGYPAPPGTYPGYPPAPYPGHPPGASAYPGYPAAAGGYPAYPAPTPTYPGYPPAADQASQTTGYPPLA